MIVNQVREDEWIAPQQLPVFDDIKEGVEFLDEQEAVAMAQLHEAAGKAMEIAQDDPKQQNYFMRVDRRTIVKDEEEFVRCQLAGIKMSVVPYSTALQLLKEEDARKKGAVKAKKAKKATKASRRKNR